VNSVEVALWFPVPDLNTHFYTQTRLSVFCVLLTVHLGMILVNNQLGSQLFTYVYFYSLHVSGNHVPIIRGNIVSKRHLVYVTLCRWQSGMHVIPAFQTVIYTEWHKPGVALIQYFPWWWAHGCPKHVENINKHTWKTVRQVAYLQRTCLSVFNFIRNFRAA